MEQRPKIVEGYDKTARQYWRDFQHELAGKPLDRVLLERFAREHAGKGRMADLACGPGQTTQFLARCGVKELIGIDLSPGMIETAAEVSPGQVSFAVGDMLALDYPDAHFGSLVCFYGVVHFTPTELAQSLREAHRVIQPGGHFLFSFHVGTGAKHVTEFLGQPVDLTFHFFEVDSVLSLATAAGWRVIEVVERHPYVGKEYPSRRAYITLARD